MSFLSSIISGFISAVLFQALFALFIYFKRSYNLSDEDIFEISKISAIQCCRFLISIFLSSITSAIHSFFLFLCLCGISYEINQQIFRLISENIVYIYPLLVVIFISVINYRVFILDAYLSMLNLYKNLALMAVTLIFFALGFAMLHLFFIGPVGRFSDHPVLIGIWIVSVISAQHAIIFKDDGPW